MADDPRAPRHARSVDAGRSLTRASARPLRGDAAERAVIAACLVLASLVAWAWLWWHQPSAAMDGMAMGGMADMAMPGNPVPPPLSATFLMWALMMVAMMLPSAMPMILLHARLMSGTGQHAARRMIVTAVFALAYVAVWTLVALAAAWAQQRLTATGVLSAEGQSFGDLRVAGTLLIVAGLYQLSPLKRLCLERCRSPLSFLMQGWRPDGMGALWLGIRHGFFCVGCCWLLMALLFVGGVMNLAWVALLALVVLAEKLLPGGRTTALVLGVIANFAGLALLARGFGVI